MKKLPKISILLFLHVIWIAQVRTQDANPRCAVRIQVTHAFSDLNQPKTTTRMSTFITTNAAVTASTPDENNNYFREIVFEFGAILPDDPTDLKETVVRGEFVTYTRDPNQRQRERNDIDDKHTGKYVFIFVFKRLRASAVLNPVRIQMHDGFEEYDVNDVFFYRVTDEPNGLTYTKVYPSQRLVPDVDVLGAGLYYGNVDDTKPFLFMGLYTSDKPAIYHVTETLTNPDILRDWEYLIEHHSIPKTEKSIVTYYLNDDTWPKYLATFFTPNSAVTIHLEHIKPRSDTITFAFDVMTPGVPRDPLPLRKVGLHDLRLDVERMSIMILPYSTNVLDYVRPVPVNDKPITTYSPNSFYTYIVIGPENFDLHYEYINMPNPSDPQAPLMLVNLRYYGYYAASPVFTKHGIKPLMLGIMKGPVWTFIQPTAFFTLFDLQRHYEQIRPFAVAANPHDEAMLRVTQTFRKFFGNPNNVTIAELEQIERVFEPLHQTSRPDHPITPILLNVLITCGSVKERLRTERPIQTNMLQLYDELKLLYPISWDESVARQNTHD